MGLRIQRVVTSGIFSLDGEDFEVDNNVWLIGDDHEVVVVDAAHDHRLSSGGAVVGDRAGLDQRLAAEIGGGIAGVGVVPGRGLRGGNRKRRGGGKHCQSAYGSP